jgi:hypothetical protein
MAHAVCESIHAGSRRTCGTVRVDVVIYLGDAELAYEVLGFRCNSRSGPVLMS